jgi:hypothetical protein
MAYGKNKGRFRETRVGRFKANMGAEQASVKSLSVEGCPGVGQLPCEMWQNTSWSCALAEGIVHQYTGLDVTFLTRKAARRRAPLATVGSSQAEAPGDGGPDEAATLIAETVAALARLVRRHKLVMLVRLLEMTQMEVEEGIRLRGKGGLS